MARSHRMLFSIAACVALFSSADLSTSNSSVDALKLSLSVRRRMDGSEVKEALRDRVLELSFGGATQITDDNLLDSTLDRMLHDGILSDQRELNDDEVIGDQIKRSRGYNPSYVREQKRVGDEVRIADRKVRRNTQDGHTQDGYIYLYKFPSSTSLPVRGSPGIPVALQLPTYQSKNTSAPIFKIRRARRVTDRSGSAPVTWVELEEVKLADGTLLKYADKHGPSSKYTVHDNYRGAIGWAIFEDIVLGASPHVGAAVPVATPTLNSRTYVLEELLDCSGKKTIGEVVNRLVTESQVIKSLFNTDTEPDTRATITNKFGQLLTLCNEALKSGDDEPYNQFTQFLVATASMAHS